MTSCVFYGRTGQRAAGAPYCTLTTYAKCDPYTCPFYKDETMLAESYEKARQNYIKTHGKDLYYELGFGPRMRQNPRKEAT